MVKDPDSEAALEAAAMDLLAKLGYETVNAFSEFSGGVSDLGRETKDQVLLLSRLNPALRRLNPDLPPEALDLAREILLADRSRQSLADANQDIHKLLKHGVKVTLKDDAGDDLIETVALIDWNAPSENDWLAVQQFWLLSRDGLYKKRTDILLFVNGIPLGFIELKVSHKRVEDAYHGNFKDYLEAIPQLFWYNAFVILSNGHRSRIGSLTAPWEHFGEWKRVGNENEAGQISLETMLRGVCAPARLLDLVENFVLFKRAGGGAQKLLARNHQVLGVNNALEAVISLEEQRGRLGVFWHTQGAGKSYSMIFFSGKVLRKLPGNWTFLIVTDRTELDEQIYQNFASVDAVPDVKSGRRDFQAQTGEELKRLLRNDSRYAFTLIQKFHTRDGEPYPLLSERDDIIVMTDEAHRSQYADLAQNMRDALPNAAYIGFTGTPLMTDEEEKTREVFGEYVSVYDFKQSVDDGATVPLYYENRVPRLQLANEDLNDDMTNLLDSANLDDAQEGRLEREFKREYQVITRAPRLEAIAEDIVAHYMVRGFAGRSYHSKAMVVCIDRFTAVKMHQLVKQCWDSEIKKLRKRLASAASEIMRQTLKEKLKFMRETDMAVVVSASQNEKALFQEKGLEIEPHWERIVKEPLDDKFKKPEDRLRLVFVCAMWMTGFDAPACSTIYLDKPMRNHTLMQTIARANRTFRDKQEGLIVDYIGVFRNLEKALAIYGTGPGGAVVGGEMPVKPKEELIEELRSAIDKAVALCARLNIDLDEIHDAEGFGRETLKRAAIEALQNGKDIEDFLNLAHQVNRLYKAILPDVAASEFYKTRKLLNILAQTIIAEIPDVDISNVEAEMKELLDESVIAEDYVIEAAPSDTFRRVDLSQIDFDALRKKFEDGYKHTAVKQLEAVVKRKLEKLLRQNPTRIDYRKTFENMLAEYNAGAVNAEVMFERLRSLLDVLEVEEKRALREQLSEEELAVFDLLTKPEPGLSGKDRKQVKRTAQKLLEKLHGKLVLDWRKHQETRASVRLVIETTLDDDLPRSAYGKDLYDDKCKIIYRHIYESYIGDGKSIYQTVA